MTSLFYNVVGLVLQAVGSGGANPPPPSRPGYEVNSPELSIDENIWLLLSIGILFGAYIMYKRSRTTNKVS